MENKKIKLTISGKPKKIIKNFENSNSKNNTPITSSRTQHKFVKKGTTFRPNKPTFQTKKPGFYLTNGGHMKMRF